MIVSKSFIYLIIFNANSEFILLLLTLDIDYRNKK